MEALTDGIIAIVATIMVLELHAPDEFTFASLKSQLPAFSAYAVSFALVILSWYNYHLLFLRSKRVDLRVYLANAAWLFVLSGMPFATSWVGKFPTHWQPELLYLGLSSLWTLLYSLTSWTLRRVNSEDRNTVDLEPRGTITVRYTILLASLILLPFWPPVGLIGTLVLMIVSVVENLVNETRNSN